MAASSGVTARRGNECFDRVPNDLQKTVFGFIEASKSTEYDKAVIGAAAVCQGWEAALRGPRRESLNRLSGSISHPYPPEILQIFQSSGTPIFRLPALHLDNQRNRGDYIDWLTPKMMPHSVMRFQDAGGRPGVAFKVRLRDKEAVLAIFKRRTDPADRTWAYAWGTGGNELQTYYEERHNAKDHTAASLVESCPTCPFVPGLGLGVHPTVLTGLLNGTDPDFSLPGHHHPVPPAGPAIAGNSGAS
jgi:hypothetical protein